MPVWFGDWSPLCRYGVSDAIKCAIDCLNTNDGFDYESLSAPTECVSVVVNGSVDSMHVIDDTKVSPVSAADNVPKECISAVANGSVDSSCVVDGIEATPVNNAVDDGNETPDSQSASGENEQNNCGRKRIRCEDS